MPRRLNFLCFVTDQMRGDHMGCAGNPVIQTPNLDRLAAAGVRFTRAYVNNPLCMPSRATLFNGLTPRAHGVRTNGIPLDRRFPTMLDALSQAGYSTHSVGKLHLLPFSTPHGVDPSTLDPAHWAESYYFWNHGILDAMPTPYFGFQTAEISIGHGPGTTGDYRRWLRGKDPGAEGLWKPEAGTPTPHNAEQAWHCAIPEELHYNTWVADRTIEFLERHAREEPFFAWCSFPDPHHPYCPPEPWARMYDSADMPMPTRREGELETLPPFYGEVYERPLPLSGRMRPTKMSDEQLREILALTYGMISHVDHNIGRVMDELDRCGLRENTVVCFLSDHGDMMGDHWMINKGPFHMNGLVHMPFIWSCPGLFAKGVTSAGLISYLDFAPTILDIAGVPIPEGLAPPEPETENQLPPWPGISFAGQLRGETGALQDSVVVENDEDYLGLRLRTLITERYKITAYPGQEYGELFDLSGDPGELHNLWHDPGRRELKRDLLIRLMERLVETDNRLPRRMSHA
ncbi:MAG: sulfatase-like hydrolase/transferase [Armatimonadota bacterium]|nr:MAG: sulfatase-like hydrolase/transferase [Armatimonadota bacterium]